MSNPSTAEKYYEKLLLPEYGYDYIASHVDKKTAENEWLEFKSAAQPNDASVRRNWSRALSGFGNTAGGVLIWGLDARKDKDRGIDCVTGLSLAPDAALFAQKLKEVLLESVIPPIQGIRITSVTKEGQKEGFVLCLIPEGQTKAHRAELDDKQFYLRINDNFVIPHVAVIRSLFSPKSRPYLVPKIIAQGPQANDPLWKMWFCVKNEGTLTARSISVVINHPDYLRFLPGQTNKTGPLEVLHENIPMELTSPVNPGMECQAFFRLALPSLAEIKDKPFAMYIRVSCEDAPAERWSREITYSDLTHPMNVLQFEPPSDSTN